MFKIIKKFFLVYQKPQKNDQPLKIDWDKTGTKNLLICVLSLFPGFCLGIIILNFKQNNFIYIICMILLGLDILIFFISSILCDLSFGRNSIIRILVVDFYNFLKKIFSLKKDKEKKSEEKDSSNNLNNKNP